MTMMTQAGAAIRIDRLKKRFRSQTAVDGLSLEIPEGSVFGLLGEKAEAQEAVGSRDAETVAAGGGPR